MSPGRGPQGNLFRHVGLALSTLRELKGQSQVEVAERAGLGKSQLSKYENGKELPKLESLGKVLNVLGSDPFGFFYVVRMLDIVRDPDAAELMLLAAPHHPLLSTAEERAFEKVTRELLGLFKALIHSRLEGIGHPTPEREDSPPPKDSKMKDGQEAMTPANEDARICRCSTCRDLGKDKAAGTIDYMRLYGDGCGNCYFFAPQKVGDADGICRKFELLPEDRGMSLSPRRLGQIREGGHAVLVGGAFVCGYFVAFHNHVAQGEG